MAIVMLDMMLFCVFGLYSWPLLFRLPFTLKALFAAYRPGGMGIADRDFWAFGPTDASFWPWYNKIARDYHTQGRFGYVWDDGLGMPLGARIYNNYLTYAILYRVGTRRMMACGYILIVSASTAACLAILGPMAGLAAALLMAVSPLLVAAFTHLGKPESFWAGGAFAFALISLIKPSLAAGLIWSALAFANLGSSVIIALIMGPALLVLSVKQHTLLLLSIGVLPGLIKHSLRLFYMHRSGFAGKLLSEQSRLWKRPWYPIPSELYSWVPFSLSLALTTLDCRLYLVGGLLALIAIFLMWANSRITYLNDELSFQLYAWIVALGFALAAHSWAGFAISFFILYARPSAFGIPSNHVSEFHRNKWHARWRDTWHQVLSFPSLSPMRLPKPTPLMEFFSAIPDGSRILFEADGDPRTCSNFRVFWVWSEDVLPFRSIDLANEMYTRLVEPELADTVLNHFNAREMTAETMSQVCSSIGASYVIAHTSETVNALKAAAWSVRATIDLSLMPTFCEIIKTPPVMLKLLMSPTGETVIDSPVAWTRRGNVLQWPATQGQRYIVRYRYDQNFKADQAGTIISVEATHCFEELPLRFMAVTASKNGILRLEFVPHVFKI